MATEEFERLLLSEPEINQEVADGIVLPNDITLKIEDKQGFLSRKIHSGEEVRNRQIKVERYDLEDTSRTTLLLSNVSEIKITGKVVEIKTQAIDDDVLSTLLPAQVYETDDWRTVTDGAPALVNDTTITNPEVDLGRPYPVYWGHAKKVKAVYVFRDTVNDKYYFIFNKGVIESVGAVYANNVVVDPGDYTTGDGSQVSPFPGFAYVCFDAERRDNSGNLLDITVDFYASTFGGASAERNVANVIKTLLSDSSVGLGQMVNAASFAAAAVHLAAIYTDGGLTEQQSAREILYGSGGLLHCALGSVIRKNTSNEWEILIDEAQTTSQQAFANGFEYLIPELQMDGTPVYQMDGTPVYQMVMIDGPAPVNIIDEPELVYPSRDNTTKAIKYKYRYNAWTGEYALKIERTVNSDFGQDVEIELPYIRNSDSVDRIAYYWQQREKRGYPYVKQKVNEDGANVDILDKVSSYWLWREDGDLHAHHNNYFLVEAFSGKIPEYELLLRKYDERIYSYVAGTLPTDPVDDDYVDYSQTPPAAPTGLSVSLSTRQGTDGTTVGVILFTATIPAVNATSAEFGYRLSSSDNYTWFPGQQSSGYVWKAEVEGPIPGQIYEYAARAVNANGLKGALVVYEPGSVFPGDTTAPTVTTLSLTAQVKEIKLSWTAPTATDWSDTIIYRGASANPTTELTKAGKVTSWTDQNPGYDTWNYRIKFLDFTGNASAYSNNVSGVVTGTEPSSTYPTNGIEINWNTGAITVVGTGSISVSGALTIESGGSLTIESGGSLSIASGGTFAIVSGGDLTIESGGTITVESGGVITISSPDGLVVDTEGGIKIEAASNPNLKVYNTSSGATAFIWSGSATTVSFGVFGATGGYSTLRFGSGSTLWSSYEDRLELTTSSFRPLVTMDLGRSDSNFARLYLNDAVYVDNVKVVGSQKAAVAFMPISYSTSSFGEVDTQLATISGTFNNLLTKLMQHGLIASS